jgi:succinyl-diaminopimelate desuccinylase
VQGHVAYPQLADNPIHRLGAPLAELVTMRWDEGNEHFPPTSLQVSNLHAGTGAGNVIPGEAVLDFNFRYSTASTPEQLKARVHELLERHGLRYTLAWTLGGLPFLTAPGTLTDAMRASIRAVTGREAVLSTTGGTSDGRFIAQICPQLVELGPINASIHKIDEHVAVADLGPLAQIYRGVLERLIA